MIAISQCEPDRNLASKLLPDNDNNLNAVELKESDKAEHYRSELISISYTNSFDGKDFPSFTQKS